MAEETKKSRARLSKKGMLAVAVILLLLIAVVLGMMKYRSWRNDGARYARKLAEQIGVATQTAEKYARLSLSGSSENASINLAMDGREFIFESERSADVSGVSIPAWVIYVDVDDNQISTVDYYDYRALGRYGTGVQHREGHIALEGITTTMDSSAVQNYIGFAPLCTSYTADSHKEVYKYYYKDENSGNTVCYFLAVNYKDGLAVSASEREDYFLLNVLSVDN